MFETTERDGRAAVGRFEEVEEAAPVLQERQQLRAVFRNRGRVELGKPRLDKNAKLQLPLRPVARIAGLIEISCSGWP